MSQNDMSVANGSGGTVRADINSALQALASQNGGSSAPSTTYANQWWFDTTNDQLKIRDEANSNWVIVASLVGTTWVPYSNGAALGTMANLAYAAIAQNLTMAADKHVAFDATTVSSGTPNFAASGNVILLTSTATANTLGTVQEGFIGFIYYGVAITITHNATSRDLIGGADIDTAVGDFEIVQSKGSGNWRSVAYVRKDGSALGGAIASQSQMEAASSNAVSVSPGRTQYHPGVAKWWANLDGTGTISTRVDHNLTSVTDGGTGRYTFTIATDYSTADWVASFDFNTSVVGNFSTWHGQVRSTNTSAMAAGSLEIQVGNAGAGAGDADLAMAIGWGDQ